jgi:hypothetical protein
MGVRNKTARRRQRRLGGQVLNIIRTYHHATAEEIAAGLTWYRDAVDLSPGHPGVDSEPLTITATRPRGKHPCWPCAADHRKNSFQARPAN